MPTLKKPSRTKQTGAICTLETKITGMQYYDGEVRDGMKAHFVRERDNAHDENAIRVENDEFQPAGHLPRWVARWFAPLIDSGKIKVEGIVGGDSDSGYSAPLQLSIYLAPKGKSILKKIENPSTGNEAMHQMVLATYEQAKKWTQAHAITELLYSLRPLRELLPETRLLLAMLSARARKIKVEQAEQEKTGLSKKLRTVRIGKGKHYHNLTVFPLFMKNGHDRHYMLLSEALDKSLAEVAEVSDDGDVPTLRLINRAPKPILIPEGEIVVGGKQNRTVNISVLVAAGESFDLPVSCVEQGRWRSESRNFSVKHHAPPNLRANKMRSVYENRQRGGSYESDQGEVWNNVASTLSAARADSTTSSITASYDEASTRIQEYRKCWTLPKTANGVMVCHGEEVIGVDLFDHHETLESLWPRLSESYALQFAYQDKEDASQAETAEAYLKSIVDHVNPADKTLGLGQSYDIQDERHIGTALCHEGQVCHLAAFSY